MPGVYISYPFCPQKCTYCNFASGVPARGLEERYLAALKAEIAAHQWRWRPETLYIGGGTPSTIAPRALEELLAPIPGRPWIEATLEAAPGTLTRERAALWQRCGVNRISLGVQSFVQAEIAGTGRKHTAEVVAKEACFLRAAGIDNFNIDLIAGLPRQTAASWLESIEWIERLQAPHVSIYMLEVDEDSRLGREILGGGSRYGAREAPGEDQVAELYELAVERLGAMGIERYEIANFARPGREARHNLKYWRLEPYVGFGADAHSFDGALRRRNAETAAGYVERFDRGESPSVEEVPARTGEERFFVGLRLTGGIRPSADEWRRFDAPIRRFLDAGLLETDGELLRLTSRGVLLSNEVFREFVSS
ncbi:MAG: radical SAM family heme chaperone HemW [Acidobacteriota bacterium]